MITSRFFEADIFNKISTRGGDFADLVLDGAAVLWRQDDLPRALFGCVLGDVKTLFQRLPVSGKHSRNQFDKLAELIATRQLVAVALIIDPGDAVIIKDRGAGKRGK